MAAQQRIVVVDDHHVFTDLLSMALTSEPALACVGTAGTAAQARTVVLAQRPDVAMIDVRLPDGDGLDLAADLLTELPDLRVIMLTAYPSADLVARAGEVGVCGLLAKELPLPNLLAALRLATPQSPVIWEAPEPDHGLTPRELQVLRLLGDGRDARGIARELGISVHTTRDHVKSVLAKLDAHSQLDAVVAAARAGIVRIGA